jgi:hypothetical protein
MTAQLKTGSPYAAELDARLRSNEPLSSIVDWWWGKYDEWLPTIVVEAEGIWNQISDHEETIFCICGADGDDSTWDILRSHRAALQAQA